MPQTAVTDYVQRRLGLGVVNVELTSEHLEDAYEDSLAWFSARKGLKAQSTLATIKDEVEYDVDSDAVYVLDVLFPEDKSYYSGTFNYEVFETDYLPYMTNNTFSTLVLAQQSVRDRKMVTASDKDWVYDPTNKKIYISPVPTKVETLKYYFTRNLVDADVDSLTAMDFDFIKRWTLASAKMMLGRIRSKFGSGFETAAGSVTLDGDTLITEAREDMEVLEEQIKDSQEPMGILFA